MLILTLNIQNVKCTLLRFHCKHFCLHLTFPTRKHSTYPEGPENILNALHECFETSLFQVGFFFSSFIVTLTHFYNTLLPPAVNLQSASMCNTHVHTVHAYDYTVCVNEERMLHSKIKYHPFITWILLLFPGTLNAPHRATSSY